MRTCKVKKKSTLPENDAMETAREQLLFICTFPVGCYLLLFDLKCKKVHTGQKEREGRGGSGTTLVDVWSCLQILILIRIDITVYVQLVHKFGCLLSMLTCKTMSLLFYMSSVFLPSSIGHFKGN